MTAKLGPNALNLTLDEFRALLKGRRGGIKSFLLNQERIAGIGNVYVQDPLFKARIHPLRKIDSLSDAEAAPSALVVWGKASRLVGKPAVRRKACVRTTKS
jgi:formamidopyrimidine-DNA glycosylase